MSAASDGRGDAAGGEVDDGQDAGLVYLLDEVVGRGQRLRLGHELVFGQAFDAPNAVLHGPHVAHGFDDVAGAGFALGADHRRAFADAAQRLAEVTAAADEGDREVVLVDVMGPRRRA